MKKGKGTHKKEERRQGGWGAGAGAPQSSSRRGSEAGTQESNISPGAVDTLLLRKTWSFGK